MATKFLLIALICALVFANTNSTRLGMEKSGPPLLGKNIWQHFPHFGGKGVGLGHRPGGAAFGGGNGNFAGGNGGGERDFAGGNNGGGDGKGEVVEHGGDEGSGKVGSAGGVP